MCLSLEIRHVLVDPVFLVDDNENEIGTLGPDFKYCSLDPLNRAVACMFLFGPCQYLLGLFRIKL